MIVWVLQCLTFYRVLEWFLAEFNTVMILKMSLKVWILKPSGSGCVQTCWIKLVNDTDAIIFVKGLIKWEYVALPLLLMESSFMDIGGIAHLLLECRLQCMLLSCLKYVTNMLFSFYTVNCFIFKILLPKISYTCIYCFAFQLLRWFV